MSVGLSTPAAADVLSPASSTISAYATPAAATPIVESPFPGHDQAGQYIVFCIRLSSKIKDKLFIGAI